jgi:hypothetical protein
VTEFPEPAAIPDPDEVLAAFRLRALDFSDDLFEALALLPDAPAELLHDRMQTFAEQLARKLTANVDVLGSLGTDDAA